MPRAATIGRPIVCAGCGARVSLCRYYTPPGTFVARGYCAACTQDPARLATLLRLAERPTPRLPRPRHA